MSRRKSRIPDIPVRRDEDQQMVIATFRVILAACVQRYGLRGKLVLTPTALAAAGSGTLRVTDQPDGTIVLEIKHQKDT